MVLRAALICLALLVTGCTSVCPEQQTLADVDGGVQRCVLATDCSAPSGLQLCANQEDQLRGCVGCVDTTCIRYVPKACP